MLRTSIQFPSPGSASTRGSRRAAQWLAVALAFSCAALAVTWVLRWVASPQAVPADAQIIGALSPEQAAQQAARLFGATPVGAASAPAAPGRFRLYGVIAGGDTGSALIGIDGKPPRAIGVGDAIAPGVILQATGYKAVWLERDGMRQELKMDPPGAQPGNVGFPGVAPRLPSFAPPALAPPGTAPARLDNER
ncbi:MAG: type II secretion system protein N [Thiomonas sp.]|uniref:type II secretion system protein N n=1 Tax=Thiomonas sp. TaxID=2047785 RepID=UPI002A365ECC|nr:type II secretion system protein N [Thiomonas sp.]MDY0331350.1 type II secretion system protein N [Thiomonas sp.]